MARFVAILVAISLHLGAICPLQAGEAPAERGFRDRVFQDADGEHKYVVFVPSGQPPEKGWPVILFLHGAGERGTDGRRQLTAGLGPAVKARQEDFPAVVVFPQAENFDRPILRTWSSRAEDGQRALAILAEVEQELPIDARQRVLAGWSMGAVGAWALAAANPDHWAALVTVSGGGNPDWAPRLGALPVWAFHGLDDSIVRPATTQRMVDAVRKAGGSVLLSEIAGAGHDVWKSVFDSQVVIDWMLSPDPELGQLESIDFTVADARLEAAPFHPALVIERAMTVRLGQQAVDIIATGLPGSLEADALSGRLADVNEKLEFDGREFDVRFTQLAYSAELERALIRAYGADRVQAEVGLRNVRLSIGHITVSDGTTGFSAGPAEVVVGHRQPVWLRIEARPAIEKQRLALKPLRSSFKIPDFNWFVREPQGIQVTEDFLTEEEVKTAIVGGIYVRRTTIEEQVLSAVPSLLAQFGDSVDLTPLEQLITALWPLPVYRPDVRVMPESISTDSAGVSVTFSAAVAAIDPSPPDRPRRVMASAPPAYQVARTTDLQVGIAVDTLDHISSLLAGTNAARIFTTDIPGQPFLELDDPSMVAVILADSSPLAAATAVETDLMLTAPFRLRPLPSQPASDRKGLGIRIEAPELAMRVSAITPARNRDQTPSDSVAQAPVSVETEPNDSAGDRGQVTDVVEPVFHGNIAIAQGVWLEPITLNNGKMGLQIAWDAESEVKMTHGTESAVAPSSDSAAADELGRLFQLGWTRWTEAQGEQVTALPDVSLGPTAMILSNLSWQDLRLSVAFAPATTRLSNSTETPLVYQVRGPYSAWSSLRTLSPGDSVSYTTGTEIWIRPEHHWEFDESSMPAGSTWECRPDEATQRFVWTRTDTSGMSPDDASKNHGSTPADR